MLQAIDERLSIWGWQTGTGVRFAVITNAWGKGDLWNTDTEGDEGKRANSRGPVDADLRPVRCQKIFL